MQTHFHLFLGLGARAMRLLEAQETVSHAYRMSCLGSRSGGWKPTVGNMVRSLRITPGETAYLR